MAIFFGVRASPEQTAITQNMTTAYAATPVLDMLNITQIPSAPAQPAQSHRIMTCRSETAAAASTGAMTQQYSENALK